jgi:hypothetical protein
VNHRGQEPWQGATMPQTTRRGPISWDRMIGAVEDVRNRLHRATAALTEVGLIDGSWPARYSEELGKRLQQLLDAPDA